MVRPPTHHTQVHPAVSYLGKTGFDHVSLTEHLTTKILDDFALLDITDQDEEHFGRLHRAVSVAADNIKEDIVAGAQLPSSEEARAILHASFRLIKGLSDGKIKPPSESLLDIPIAIVIPVLSRPRKPAPILTARAILETPNLSRGKAILPSQYTHLGVKGKFKLLKLVDNSPIAQPKVNQEEILRLKPSYSATAINGLRAFLEERKRLMEPYLAIAKGNVQDHPIMGKWKQHGQSFLASIPPSIRPPLMPLDHFPTSEYRVPSNVQEISSMLAAPGERYDFYREPSDRLNQHDSGPSDQPWTHEAYSFQTLDRFDDQPFPPMTPSSAFSRSSDPSRVHNYARLLTPDSSPMEQDVGTTPDPSPSESYVDPSSYYPHVAMQDHNQGLQSPFIGRQGVDHPGATTKLKEGGYVPKLQMRPPRTPSPSPEIAEISWESILEMDLSALPDLPQGRTSNSLVPKPRLKPSMHDSGGSPPVPIAGRSVEIPSKTVIDLSGAQPPVSNMQQPWNQPTVNPRMLGENSDLKDVDEDGELSYDEPHLPAAHRKKERKSNQHHATSKLNEQAVDGPSTDHTPLASGSRVPQRPSKRHQRDDDKDSNSAAKKAVKTKKVPKKKMKALAPSTGEEEIDELDPSDDELDPQRTKSAASQSKGKSTGIVGKTQKSRSKAATKTVPTKKRKKLAENVDDGQTLDELIFSLASSSQSMSEDAEKSKSVDDTSEIPTTDPYSLEGFLTLRKKEDILKKSQNAAVKRPTTLAPIEEDHEEWKSDKRILNPKWYTKASTSARVERVKHLPVLIAPTVLQNIPLVRALEGNAFELIERDKRMQETDIVLSSSTAVVIHDFSQLLRTHEDLFKQLKTAATYYTRVILILQVVPFDRPSNDSDRPMPDPLKSDAMSGLGSLRRSHGYVFGKQNELIGEIDFVFAYNGAEEVARALSGLCQQELVMLQGEMKRGPWEDVCNLRDWLRVEPNDWELQELEDVYKLNTFCGSYALFKAGEGGVQALLEVTDDGREKEFRAVFGSKITDRFNALMQEQQTSLARSKQINGFA